LSEVIVGLFTFLFAEKEYRGFLPSRRADADEAVVILHVADIALLLPVHVNNNGAVSIVPSGGYPKKPPNRGAVTRTVKGPARTVPAARLHDVYDAEQQIAKALPKSGLFCEVHFCTIRGGTFLSIFT
jgi:hypothetical protein